jgi:hydrogenase maturation protease
MTRSESGKILVLGIGNVLMGDEGVGVHVVRHLETMQLPDRAECLDGGTGAFVLLGPMENAARIVLIDATIDGSAPGTVRRLEPRYSQDYPRTLTAHDIGLKDLLDVFYLSGRHPDVVLFAVSIDPLQEMVMELSPAVARAVPQIAKLVLEEVTRCDTSVTN